MLDMPGPRAGAPGEYGWTGRPGLAPGCTGSQTTARPPSCVSSPTGIVLPKCGRGTVPVTVAGYEGAYLEPYQPPVTFVGMGDEITRAYELKIGSAGPELVRLRDLASNHDRRRTGRRSRYPRHDPR